MRIITYNISQYRQEKVDRLLPLDADVYVLPECGNEKFVTLPDGYHMLWDGDASCQWKGLAVIWKDRLRIHPVRPLDGHHEKVPYTLPLMVDGAGFPKFLLAVWPTRFRDRRPYPGLLMAALRQFEFYLSRFDAIVTGDFNCFPGQPVHKESPTFTDCIRFLEGHGLRSAYHELTGEEFGEESKATYYHYRHADQPMMLDYTFTSAKPGSFQIGDWNSEDCDHCPLVLDLEEEDWDDNP